VVVYFHRVEKPGVNEKRSFEALEYLIKFL
jgi:hypothetical protein